MADEKLVLSEQETVELLAFLLSSARGLIREPKDYGPMRLLVAAERLSRNALPRANAEFAPSLRMMADGMEFWHWGRRQDPEGYVAFLDECCEQIARDLLRRAAFQESGEDDG